MVILKVGGPGEGLLEQANRTKKRRVKASFEILFEVQMGIKTGNNWVNLLICLVKIS
tara:strand:- start:571 stop:741 length:171 start_codon:yes stop_codon:yes gene_type:complete